MHEYIFVFVRLKINFVSNDYLNSLTQYVLFFNFK